MTDLTEEFPACLQNPDFDTSPFESSMDPGNSDLKVSSDSPDLNNSEGIGQTFTPIGLDEAVNPVHDADSDEQFTDNDDKSTIARLAQLSPLDYDRVRESEAENLGVRIATLDKAVRNERKNNEDCGLQFDFVEPWPEPVELAQLLNDITHCIRRFIVCDPEIARAIALWVLMTWFIDAVQIAPLAVITSPEKRCGKTQLLSLLGRLVNRPLTSSNISPAALFRVIDAWQPTLLIDEADAFMKENEELRGLINCGHTRESAYVIRVVGDDHVPTRFSAWGAKAISGIGHLKDTVMDRAVVFELRRKLPHESVDRIRHAEPDLFDTLRSKAARVALDFRTAVQTARPQLPEELNDRAQDNWEPLLAIADLAGGDWPTMARDAALKLSGSEASSMSVGVELLSDIRDILDAKKATKISTVDLIEALCEDEEQPWATYNRGYPITPRQLSGKLKGYGIHSKDIRVNNVVIKGYEVNQFQEAFNRYLRHSSTDTPLPNATALQIPNDAASTVADKNVLPQQQYLCATRQSENVADKTQRSVYQNISATSQSPNSAGCSAVADSDGGVVDADVERF